MSHTDIYTGFARIRKGVKTAGVFLFFFLASFHIKAQTVAARAYQVKAVFLYNFSQFVEWPPTAFSSNSAPFVIGILGNDPFGSYIDETVAGENMMGHPMVVQRYHTVKDITDCHILFINTDDDMLQVLTALGNRSILTVSDDKNFAKKGGMIRFFTVNNKVRLRINLSSAKAANLTISSKLLRLAEIVD